MSRSMSKGNCTFLPVDDTVGGCIEKRFLKRAILLEVGILAWVPINGAIRLEMGARAWVPLLVEGL